MAHILPLSQPPILAVSKGIAFGGTYLGYEVHLSESQVTYEQQVNDLREAVANLTLSQDPDEQLIRKQIDQRFTADTAGVPPDWPFGQEEGNITDLLAEAPDERIITFCDWHREHFGRLQAAISSTTPEMLDRSHERVNRLYKSGLMPKGAISTFMSSVVRLVHNNKVRPIDSFDGALIDGRRDSRGIYLSHRFDDGYYIGAPTQRYWDIGFHECGHEIVARSGTSFDEIAPLEEVLVEHFTSVSSETADQAVAQDIYRAADTEQALYYVPLRKLFGIMLARSPHKRRASELAPLLTSNDAELLRQVRVELEEGFDRVFPEVDGGALSAFLTAYANTSSMRKGEMAEDWLNRAVERVGPPDLID